MSRKSLHLHGNFFPSSLDEKSVDPDPFRQFSAWLEAAQNAGADEPEAMVLSTCDADGNVSGRVVLLKGTGKNGFIFYTGYDSRKGKQLAANPKAALTFHWPRMERQVRVEGSVSRISRKESEAYFDSRPADSRISACISPQSCVIPERAFLEAMRDGLLLDLAGDAPRCPDNWGGYILKPVLIEFWQGREHRLHDRVQYRLTGRKWVIERLAP